MILTIIQARMMSTRLPGKVMKEILGQPLIGYMLERLEHSRCMDKVIVATSEHESNDVLCDYLTRQGYEFYRGSEEDVLRRYYHAARSYNPEAVVRMTADCPLIDPEICDALIKAYRDQECDYAYMDPSFAEGLDCEIFSFQALTEMNHKAKLRSEREHVTRYLRNHLDQFKVFKLINNEENGHYRIGVDDPEDFLVVKAVIEEFYGNGNPERSLSFKAIKKYLDEHPDIMTLNAHIIRNEGLIKSLSQDEPVY